MPMRFWQKIQGMPWKPYVRVAVAVITDANQRLLIAKRPVHVPSPGLWEFPGGKLEADETADEALIREIKEEIGLDVKGYNFLGEVNYTYPDLHVNLLVYHVNHFEGEPLPCEGQMDLRWVDFDSLGDYEFPAANVQVIGLIRLKMPFYN